METRASSPTIMMLLSLPLTKNGNKLKVKAQRVKTKE
jgi:hypothetical protein